MKKTMLSWSSGKDSAWTLHVLKQQPDIELVGLFSTVNAEYERVAMHAVRVELLKEQAAAVGLPVQLIPIPYPCTNADYEAIMTEFVDRAKAQGVDHFAFGDLFLEDVRAYREKQLAGTGMTPLFPLWGLPTDVLSRQMVDSGLRAQITCIDPRQLPERFAGQEFNADFLDRLPEGVDPCGERGEFHSFAFDGPMFHRPVRLRVGETVTRDGFVFTDLLSESD